MDGRTDRQTDADDCNTPWAQRAMGVKMKPDDVKEPVLVWDKWCIEIQYNDNDNDNKLEQCSVFSMLITNYHRTLTINIIGQVTPLQQTSRPPQVAYLGNISPFST